jgi:hypothetical protein
MRQYEHARLYGLKPANKTAAVVTDQSGVTDTVELTGAEMKVEVLERRRKLRKLPKSLQDKAARQQLGSLAARVKERNKEECDLQGIQLGDSFVVFHRNGDFAYEDTVRTINNVGIRGHRDRRIFFALSTGMTSGNKPYFARRKRSDLAPS